MNLNEMMAVGLSQNRIGALHGGWRDRPAHSLPLHAGFPFPESLPHQELAKAAATALGEDGPTVLQYGGGAGVKRLHEFMLSRSDRQGLLAQESAGMLTTGSGQGLDLICQILLNPDDCVAVETPTYMGAVIFLRNYVCDFLHLPMDKNGLNVEAAASILAGRKRLGKRMPKFLYTIPTYHNPSGATMPLERRLALLDLARQYNFFIVEDDAYNSLGWGNPPPAALRTLDTDNRVIYLTTLSKTVGPGVRAGWALAHPDVIWQMQRIKTDGVQAFSHSTVMAYLSQTDFEARIAWLCDQYHLRCETMLTALKAQMPTGVAWSRPTGGFFIWLEFLGGKVNTNQLATESTEAGCTFIPGEAFYTDGAGTHALRLSFSFATPEEITRGIGILAKVVRRYL